MFFAPEAFVYLEINSYAAFCARRFSVLHKPTHEMLFAPGAFVYLEENFYTAFCARGLSVLDGKILGCSLHQGPLCTQRKIHNIFFAPGASVYLAKNRSWIGRKSFRCTTDLRPIRDRLTIDLRTLLCAPPAFLTLRSFADALRPTLPPPPAKTSPDLSEPSNWHRSHFGSRYKLGCCGHASLLAAVRIPRNAQCTHNVLAVTFDTTNWSLFFWGKAKTPLLGPSPAYDLRPLTYGLCYVSHDVTCGPRPIIHYPCHVAYDTWPMTCDVRSRTCDLCPMRCAIWLKTYDGQPTNFDLWLMFYGASPVS